MCAAVVVYEIEKFFLKFRPCLKIFEPKWYLFASTGEESIFTLARLIATSHAIPLDSPTTLPPPFYRQTGGDLKVSTLKFNVVTKVD